VQSAQCPSPGGLGGFGGGGGGGVGVVVEEEEEGGGPSSVPVSAEGVLAVGGALPLRRRQAHFRLGVGV